MRLTDTPRQCGPPRLPRGESVDHFMLKQVAAIWLYGRGHKWTVTEAPLPYGMARTHCNRSSGRSIGTVDAMGLRQCRKGMWTISIAEVKVSRGDYQSGFSVAGHMNYVVTPPGLVSLQELPDGVGLIECDWRKFVWNGGHSFRGIHVARRPTRKALELSDANSNEIMFGFMAEISRTLSCRVLYSSPWLTDRFRQ